MLLNVSMPPPGTSAKLMSAEQTDLPFTGLKDPNSVAVATNGDVYITDAGHRRVLKLGVGSTQQPNGTAVGRSVLAGGRGGRRGRQCLRRRHDERPHHQIRCRIIL
jgi:hypothetical protein